MSHLTAPRKLRKSDDLSGFRSGAADLDEWLVKYGWENQAANNATTYVITDGDRVVAFYSIAMATVAKSAAPSELLKGSRPSQIPCILLARLAVDERYGGQGLGAELLRDALLRSIVVSDSIGAAAVLVHCRDENARDFYLHLGDFVPSPRMTCT
ncbi:GNAT family N-acetyltransferase [Microbacterium sp. KUDC0406]|uniref:GNAT family N-acetyltransferase n=1 Tax=Microbacterium sp. KUDC0406 TaxID=2909588 RepID=UPI001F327376|nr:GNAT family N-acetyltransferase [Microbacterium sp. KUDC0406]UJP09392.1 GNAT family N-acetyltransferase [Microbacterium sp. KUDC0406]